MTPRSSGWGSKRAQAGKLSQIMSRDMMRVQAGAVRRETADERAVRILAYSDRYPTSVG